MFLHRARVAACKAHAALFCSIFSKLFVGCGQLLSDEIDKLKFAFKTVVHNGNDWF